MSCSNLFRLLFLISVISEKTLSTSAVECGNTNKAKANREISTNLSYFYIDVNYLMWNQKTGGSTSK